MDMEGSRSVTPPQGKGGGGAPQPHHRRRVSSFAALTSSTTSKVSLLGFLAIVCVFPFLFSSVSQQQQALEQYGAPGFRYEPLSAADKSKQQQKQQQQQQHLRVRGKPFSSEEAAVLPSDATVGEQQPAQPQYEPQAVGAKPEAAAPAVAAAAKPNQQKKEAPAIYMDWVLPSDRYVRIKSTRACVCPRAS